MVTFTEDPQRHFAPDPTSDSIGADFLYDMSDNNRASQLALRRLSEKALSSEDLEELVFAVKAYLEKATKARSLYYDPNPSLNDRVYTWTASDSDVRGLLLYIPDATEGSRQIASKDEIENTLSDSRSSGQRSHILSTMPPIAVGPATTISMPEVSFASDGRTQQRRGSSTTATILSRDKITEIIWQDDMGRLEAAGDPQKSPLGSGISRLSPDKGSDETSRESLMSIDSRSRAKLSSKPGLVGRDISARLERSSTVIMTKPDKTAHQAAQEVEEVESESSYLTRFRKKSVQLGQAIGSFMNGDYRNADHKPRRESTIFRLRSALDRVEPSRPKQDAVIFGAFTGATAC